MNILGIIPARGGSKGIKDKNIIELNNKPLVGYTIEAALDAKRLNRIVLSTDSEKIAQLTKDLYSIEIINRPSGLAQDNSSLEDAMLHTLEHLKENEKYEPDIVVLMQANVPIRKEGLVDIVVEKLINSQADSCVTCFEAEQKPELMKKMDAQGQLKPFMANAQGLPRQLYEKRYLLDGAVVAMKAKNLFDTRGSNKAHAVLGETVIPCLQEKRMFSLEIDDMEDLELARFYMLQSK